MLLQVKAVQDEAYKKKTKILHNIIQDESISYEDLELFLYLLHNTKDGIWKWDLQSDKITGSQNLWKNIGLEPNKVLTKKDFFKMLKNIMINKYCINIF